MRACSSCLLYQELVPTMGVADALTTIDGKKTAVDAKYDKDWNSSIRNPNSKIGQKNFNKNEQNNMVIYLFILY